VKNISYAPEITTAHPEPERGNGGKKKNRQEGGLPVGQTQGAAESQTIRRAGAKDSSPTVASTIGQD